MGKSRKYKNVPGGLIIFSPSQVNSLKDNKKCYIFFENVIHKKDTGLVVAKGRLLFN